MLSTSIKSSLIGNFDFLVRPEPKALNLEVLYFELKASKVWSILLVKLAAFVLQKFFSLNGERSSLNTGL